MTMSQRLMTGLAAFSLVGGMTALAAAPAGAAERAAVTRPARAACVFPKETTNAQGTNRHGFPTIYGGSYFAKPRTSTCHDLNLWRGQIGVRYEGWLYHGNGNWTACHAGYLRYSGRPLVLCSGVLPGTLEGVTASNGFGHGIQIMD